MLKQRQVHVALLILQPKQVWGACIGTHAKAGTLQVLATQVQYRDHCQQYHMPLI
jgi:hypothetical protein